MQIMKYFLLIGLGCMACENKSAQPAQKEVVPQKTTRAVKHDVATDTSVMALSREVLIALKNKTFIKLSSYFHPELGVRFSPYGYIDTTVHQLFYTKMFLDALNTNAKLYWGAYDGSGDSIWLTFPAYYRKFIYNADFLNAEKTSLNKRISTGNSLNNIDTIYPGSDYTESFFSGFDKKYAGMDWTALRLVFKPYRGKHYLVAIIHDQWTT